MKKSPSQRLRGALYYLYELSDTKETFDEYYERYIEYFIKTVSNEVKKKEQNSETN